MVKFKEARKGLFKSMKSLFQYLRDVRAEMTHVKWPTGTQAIGYTVLVIAISAAVAALLGGLDAVFTFGIQEIINLSVRGRF